jgi:ribokinase
MDPSVVVVGSVNVDLVVQVSTLPAAGETAIGGTFSRSPGGKGGNQAVAAARLGARTWFVGLTGRDDLGTEARRDLADAGVDVSHLGTADAPTGVAAILVDGDGENLIAVASGANGQLSGDHVRRALERLGSEPAVVLAGLEVPDGAVVAAAEAAARRRWPFVLNAAPARPVPEPVLTACEVVVANEIETASLGGLDRTLGSGTRAVVVTRGPDGADIHRPGQDAHHQPAFPIEAVDSTGAGDAFVATVAWALAESRDLEDAVRLATAAGALACREVGARTALTDRAELERFAAPGQEG